MSSKFKISETHAEQESAVIPEGEFDGTSSVVLASLDWFDDMFVEAW